MNNRTATIVAEQPTVLFALDRNTFTSIVKFNDEVKKVFDRHSHSDASDMPGSEIQRYMNEDGFVNALLDYNNNSQIANENTIDYIKVTITLILTINITLIITITITIIITIIITITNPNPINNHN